MHEKQGAVVLVLLALSPITGCKGKTAALKPPVVQEKNTKHVATALANKTPATKPVRFVNPQVQPLSSASLSTGNEQAEARPKAPSVGRPEQKTTTKSGVFLEHELLASYNRIVASLREASPTNSITKLKEVLTFLEVLYHNRTTPALDHLSVRDLNDFAGLLIGLVACILSTEEHTKKAIQLVRKEAKEFLLDGSKASLPYFLQGRREKALWARKSATHRNPMLIGAYTMKLIEKTVIWVIKYATEEKERWHFKEIKYPIEVGAANNTTHMKRIMKMIKKSTAEFNLIATRYVEVKNPCDEKYFRELKGIIFNRAPFYIGKHRKVKGKEKICCISLSKNP